jgi:two-component system, OmpR family, phosphate regulon response regulator PhoB
VNPPVSVVTRAPAQPQDLRPLGSNGTSTLAAPNGAEHGELTILVAEDDHSCRSALLQYFERSGYRVTEAADGPSTLRAVFQHSASLVILDLGLPGFDGTDVLAKIRRHSAVPVIVCSGRDSEEDRIRTLNLGADDFVVKPFSFAELEARVRAVLRRGNGEPAATCLHHGELVVDRDTRTVTVQDRSIPMTRKEFDLLAFLAASPGQVFSREDLLERVWGSTEEWQGRSTVTEHVRRVRLRSSPIRTRRAGSPPCAASATGSACPTPDPTVPVALWRPRRTSPPSSGRAISGPKDLSRLHRHVPTVKTQRGADRSEAAAASGPGGRWAVPHGGLGGTRGTMEMVGLPQALARRQDTQGVWGNRGLASTVHERGGAA